MARSTWIRNAGSSRLDYMPNPRCFTWYINVGKVSTFPLSFTGEIDIYLASSNAYKGTLYISGVGIGCASGTISATHLGLRSGTRYIAKYSGTAKDLVGNIFTIVNGASISFIY